MSSNIKLCKQCRRMFQSYGNNTCSDCIDRLDREYRLIKEYIYDHENADIFEISEHTGASEKTILELLREGRLEIANTDGLLTCIECSKPISAGRYCSECMAKLEKALRSVVKIEEKRSGPSLGKMHADYRKE